MKIPRAIYALRHNPTGKVYVGSSSNVKKRAMNHVSRLRCGTHSHPGMQADFDRYGDDYTVYILEHLKSYAERDHEHLWMEALHSRDPERGYNDRDRSNGFSLEQCEHMNLDKPEEEKPNHE